MSGVSLRVVARVALACKRRSQCLYFMMTFTRVQNTTHTFKKYKPGTTVQNKHKQICNHIPRYQMPRKQITKQMQTHTGGLSENCSRLQSPCRHHFGNWQGYSAALGDGPSQLRKHHVAYGWRLESEQRSFTVSFLPLICLRTFVCVSFHTLTQVVANRCALRQNFFFVLSLDSQCLKSSSAPWHAQYHVVEPTH